MAVYGGEPKNDHKYMVDDVRQMGSSYNKTYHTHTHKRQKCIEHKQTISVCQKTVDLIEIK